MTSGENDLHFGHALKEARLALGMSQEQLALESDLDRTYISMLERNVKNPTLATISKLAKTLGVTPLQLVARSQQLAGKSIDYPSSVKKKNLIRPPIYGTSISCGKPISENFEIEKVLSLDEELVKNPAETFFIKASGDSMGPTIWDGDILIVNTKKKPTNGSIVVAQINGEFSVKRLFHVSKVLKLIPDNVFYKEIVITDLTQFHIFGIVTGVARNLVGMEKK